MGTTTYRLTHLQRTGPSSGSFEIPSDDTVKEEQGGIVLYRETHKEQ